MFAYVIACCAALPLPIEAKEANYVAVHGVDLHIVEAKVVELTNARRAAAGLPELQVDERLVKSARRHTAWMTNNRSLQHQGGVAENIAMGQSTASEVVQTWMNSSGHRANMMGGYSRIGVAAYVTPGGTIYWCQQFLR